MLLIGNGKLFTRDEERPYLPDGAVVIDGDTVQEVGSLADMKAVSYTHLPRGRPGWRRIFPLRGRKR